MSLDRVRDSGTTDFQIGSRSVSTDGVSEIGETSTGPDGGHRDGRQGVGHDVFS